MEMLDVIVRAQKYDITLRPHPNEDSEFYKKYLDALPADLKSNVTFDLESTIYEQILNCDLEISCETCTTALESWISKNQPSSFCLKNTRCITITTLAY